ncbi:MAG: hypothetical protein WBP61_16785 [Nocardioides sp.]
MRWIISIATLLGICLGGATATALAALDPPPGDTIVEVTGDRANGFEIRHYDGSALYPPTGSEARAECSAYDTRVARVRCRTEVRTWYRDLGDLKRALDWAHDQ